MAIIVWPACEAPTLATGVGGRADEKAILWGSAMRITSAVGCRLPGLFVYDPDEEIAQGRLDMSGREPAHCQARETYREVAATQFDQPRR